MKGIMRAFLVFITIAVGMISCALVVQNSRCRGASTTADLITMVPVPEKSRGLISGMLSDAVKHDPLPGGVIVLLDTPFGANTDIAGRYYINNLKPGVYTVKGKYIAYYPVVVKNVKIARGFTTILDIRLSPHHLDHPDYVVEVADSMVTVDVVAKTITINIGDVGGLRHNRQWFPDDPQR